jgi:hypothetical protein
VNCPPSGSTDAAREPLVTEEVLLPESDQQPVLWPVLLGAELNVLVCTIGAALRLVVHQTFCHVQNALLAVPSGIASNSASGVELTVGGAQFALPRLPNG